MLRSVCLWLSCSCFLLIRIALADPPPEAVVSHPVVHEVVDYGDFVGRAEAVNSVDLRALSGYLVKSLFKPGGAVRQGDLLFEIDPRPYQAEVEKRKAETQLAAARVRRLAADLQRLGKPIARGAVSAEDLDRTRAELEEAEAALPVAQARLQAAALELEFTRIQAPIGGTIGLPSISLGNLVTADTTSLATIVSADPVYVGFDIDERTALQLRRKAQDSPGKVGGKTALPVACTLADESGFPRRGLVDAANNRVDPVTRTLHVRAVLPNPGGLIIPGMSVRVRLALNKP